MTLTASEGTVVKREIQLTEEEDRRLHQLSRPRATVVVPAASKMSTISSADELVAMWNAEYPEDQIAA